MEDVQIYYAIKVTYRDCYSRTLPYRYKKTEDNLKKVEKIAQALNSYFFKDYTHEVVEVGSGPENFKV